MQVITDLNVDRAEVRKMLGRNGLFSLNPVKVTRTEMRDGLLCMREEELCWMCSKWKPSLVNEPLVNDVIKDHKVFV